MGGFDHPTPASLEEVRQWLNTALDLLERLGVRELDTSNGYYWDIDPSDAVIVDGDPPTPGLGDLHDDIADIRGELANMQSSDGVIVWHLLDHLRGVVTALTRQSHALGVWFADEEAS